MPLYEKYVPTTEFKSYQDFCDGFTINVPENFNYAYDVVDDLAAREPDRLALLWISNAGEERRLSFGELKQKSDKAANFFKRQGIEKGDKVMLVLKRHYQFWYTILALHKLGAVAVPATNLLTTKDYVYRCNAASVKMIVVTSDGDVTANVDAALKDAPTLQLRAVTGGKQCEGWLDYDAQIESESAVFERPVGKAATNNGDMMLLYFTSGTTGYPKMVWHDFT